jgi:predicted regulator of Ras-like GTPase activity (Roadblock/LC7/MglB family)
MSLRTTLDQWPSRESIRAAAVINEDGLLIHDALTAGMDAEAVAALAVTLLQTSRQLAVAADGGNLGSMVLELDQGPAVVTALDHRHTLVIMAQPHQDIGPLLHDIRRQKSHLAGSV